MDTNQYHGFDGMRHYDSSSYEGMVFACLCGERFVDGNDLKAHVEAEEPKAKCDAMLDEVAYLLFGQPFGKLDLPSADAVIYETSCRFSLGLVAQADAAKKIGRGE